MSLKNQIHKDFIIAFKEKDKVKKDLLSVVKGEIQKKEFEIGLKELDDDNVSKILKKLVKSINQVIINSKDKDSIYELSIIEDYLPKQMSDGEIKAKVDSLYEDGCRNIGEFMKEFSSLPADKKVVSQIVRGTLASYD